MYVLVYFSINIPVNIPKVICKPASLFRMGYKGSKSRNLT